MIKKTLILFVVIIFASSLLAAQAKEGFGVGLIIGEPTGISIKNWTGANQAFDAGIAWSFSGKAALHLHADYLLHDYSLLNLGQEFPLYYGLGARLKLQENNNGNDPRVGVRVPVGITYLPAGSPLDFFLEIVPLFDLMPSTGFDMNGAIGARYYF